MPQLFFLIHCQVFFCVRFSYNAVYIAGMGQALQLFPAEDKELDALLASRRKQLSKNHTEKMGGDWLKIGQDIRHGIDKYARGH